MNGSFDIKLWADIHRLKPFVDIDDDDDSTREDDDDNDEDDDIIAKVVDGIDEDDDDGDEIIWILDWGERVWN